jgi:hypothetical protein
MQVVTCWSLSLPMTVCEEFLDERWLAKTKQLLQEDFMFDPQLFQVAWILQQEYLKQAEMKRLSRQSEASRTGWYERLQLGLADYLIYLGRRMKARRQVAQHPVTLGRA